MTGRRASGEVVRANLTALGHVRGSCTVSTLSLSFAVALLCACGPAGEAEAAPVTCTRSCAGRACGADGCGGSCGTCAAGASCVGSQCLADSQPSLSCPGGLRCVADEHFAYAFECTRDGVSGPWICTRLHPKPSSPHPDLIGCVHECRWGESGCNEADSWEGAQCRACESACAETVEVRCAAESAQSCPAPCACR